MNSFRNGVFRCTKGIFLWENCTKLSQLIIKPIDFLCIHNGKSNNGGGGDLSSWTDVDIPIEHKSLSYSFAEHLLEIST